MIADISSEPAAATGSLPGQGAVLREADAICETPENWTIYRRPDLNDPAFLELCASIRKSGINTPLEISGDDYIISGHRRFIAAQCCGINTIPCLIDPTVVMGHLDERERVALLVERNRGTRIKSDSELYLEAAAAVDPDEAIRQAQDRKAQVLDYIKTCKLPEVQVAGSISRTDPNGERAEMLNAVLDILGDLRAADFLPTSGRSIHYKLLAKHVRQPARTVTSTAPGRGQRRC